MKLHYTMSLAVAGLATALTLHAQPAVSTNTGGLLGQRYAEASVGAIDPHNTSDYGFSGDLGVNLPVQTGLDAGFTYSYDRIHEDIGGAPFRLRSRDHTVGATLTAYNNFGNLKPFFGAGIGYTWNRTKLDFGGTRVFDTKDDDAIWALGTGVEIPCGTFTLTPSISYQDGFSRDAASGFAYSAEAHTWFTRTVGGFARLTFSDPTGGGTQAWIYRAGVRLRF